MRQDRDEQDEQAEQVAMDGMAQEEIRPYLAEYPRFCRTLHALITQAQQGAAGPVALLALFGSVARLEPARWSDADLLVLFREQPSSRARYRQQVLRLLRCVRATEIATGNETLSWPLTPVIGMADGSDLDTDFLAEVGHHGVHLYLAPGYRPPAPLAALQPLGRWVMSVEALLGHAANSDPHRRVS